MELKLARTSINEKPKNIGLEKIEEILEKEGQKFFYFDKDNTHKQILAFVNHFGKKGLSVYHRSLKYGLDDNDFMYEVHIL
ncbi:hypothetical protein LNU06_05715 [Campylobacter sp. VicNov18]|uniref:HP0268 family nuclease n=1 Tax=Campylobacter bilis TaxID=2691918 RepID=UPI00130E0664|nr:HP0268 family nuclease [Campylobacter bilis]MPV64003.1 hypothetical protein [Campylobacter hepaticus]MBM0637504.1 hypothetical protein [Campylobacter bilis]MCC8278226.1 hypothetical protein [Campylobacter bilis]MCC8299730.1 hypothetical protein [Campylobacter bilis]MCC8301135.1 hypothetical protein [Campylobacter bilis]